jgi:RHS repeat-associated protein
MVVLIDYRVSNQLTSTPSATYTYDANGNTLSRTDSSGTTTYAWDYESGLTNVTLPGSGGTVTFKYDPFGRRIQKVSSGGTSVFDYDGDNLIEETTATGAVVARYTQGLSIDEPLAMLRSGATSFYNADGLGSVTSLTNAGGALAQTYTFDSFGKQTASSGSLTNALRCTGREFDAESSLYFMRARHFDPATGRFIGEDPLDFAGGINFYAYSQNNPVLVTDPFGLSPLSSCVWACIKINYGLTRDAGVILGLTAPIIPKAVVLPGSTGATSIASAVLRKALPCRIRPVLAPTLKNLGSRTPVLGAAAARWLGWIGVGLLAADVYGIQDCTRQCERDNWFPPACSSCEQK